MARRPRWKIQEALRDQYAEFGLFRGRTGPCPMGLGEVAKRLADRSATIRGLSPSLT
jgi:hypothetical protein